MGKIILSGDLLPASVLQAAIDAAGANDHEIVICSGTSVETNISEIMIDNFTTVVPEHEEFEDLNTLVVEPNTKTKGKHKQPFYNKGRW